MKILKICSIPFLSLHLTACSPSSNSDVSSIKPVEWQGCIDMDTSSHTFDDIRGNDLTEAQMLATCSIWNMVYKVPDIDGNERISHCAAFTTAEDDDYYYHTTAGHCFETDIGDSSKHSDFIEIYETISDEVITVPQFGGTHNLEEGLSQGDLTLVHRLYGSKEAPIDFDLEGLPEGSDGSLINLYGLGKEDMGHGNLDVESQFSYDAALFKTRKEDHLWDVNPLEFYEDFKDKFDDYPLTDETSEEREVRAKVIDTQYGSISVTHLIDLSWTNKYDINGGTLSVAVYGADCDYNTTIGGSSGSPAIDDYGKVISIHAFRREIGLCDDSGGPIAENVDLYQAMVKAEGK